jgi:hypothetical protein
LDLFTGSGPTRTQIHDIHFLSYSPPFIKPTDANFGPFWTGAVPEASVTGSPYTALMSLDLKNAVQSDSVVPFGPTETPAMATVHVDWMPGLNGLYPTTEGAPTYVFSSPAAGFAGEYTLAGAHIDFSVTTQVSPTDKTPFTFTSDPGGQRVLFAQVGHEVDGTFLH